MSDGVPVRWKPPTDSIDSISSHARHGQGFPCNNAVKTAWALHTAYTCQAEVRALPTPAGIARFEKALSTLLPHA